MKREKAWFHDPTKVVSLCGGLIALVTWMGSGFIAHAKTEAKVDAVSTHLETLEGTIKTHTQKLEETEVRQQLLQQDMGYVKDSVKEILEEVKKKR